MPGPDLQSDALEVTGQFEAGTGQVSGASSLVTLGSVPVFNSLPGVAATLYLDFDGHFEASWGSYSNLTTPVYDRDGDPTTFNAEEAAYIEEVWQIVAEDYAPFNINVTTVEPAVLAAGVPSSQANGVALRVSIGGTSEILGISVGGYGYYNSFTNSVVNAAYVFTESTTGTTWTPVFVGSTVSHEAAHSFGLRHVEEVYELSGNWKAIMKPYTVAPGESTWATGLNDQGNFQDDMAMLSNSLNGFGYRPDDHGGTIASATPLTGSGVTFTGSGIVGRMNDVDMFSLTTANLQNLKIEVVGSETEQNLDVVVDFLDAAGDVILTANPADSLGAELFVPVSGTAYLAVRSTGAYGHIGQYTIRASESSPGARVTTASPTSRLSTSEAGGNDSFTVSLTSRPTADVVIPISSSDPSEGTVSTGQLIFTPTNWYLPQLVNVLSVDDSEVDGIVDYTIDLGPITSNDPNYSAITVQPITASNVDDDVPGWAFQLSASGSDTVYPRDLKVDVTVHTFPIDLGDIAVFRLA